MVLGFTARKFRGAASTNRVNEHQTRIIEFERKALEYCTVMVVESTLLRERGTNWKANNSNLPHFLLFFSFVTVAQTGPSAERRFGKSAYRQPDPRKRVTLV